MRLLPALVAFAPLAVQARGMTKAADPVCVRAEIVPGFETFGTPGAGEPAVGKTAAVTLTPANVSTAGKRPFKPGTYQGRYPLKVAKPGDYRVALSQGAWISIANALGEVESTAHGHGAPCSGIAKIVTFPLKAGTYRLDLREAKAAGIVVAVAK